MIGRVLCYSGYKSEYYEGVRMDNSQKAVKKFYEDQLLWTKEQVEILDEIDRKLHEMKRIAEYALDCNLTPQEVATLNHELNELKEEVQFLHKKLQTIVH